MWVRRLKSKENRLPQPSNVHCKIMGCLSSHVQLCTHAYLKWLLPCVHQLMSLQLWTLHKSFATLCTYMNTRPMGMKMLPHGSIVPKHFATTLKMKHATVFIMMANSGNQPCPSLTPSHTHLLPNVLHRGYRIVGTRIPMMWLGEGIKTLFVTLPCEDKG